MQDCVHKSKLVFLYILHNNSDLEDNYFNYNSILEFCQVVLGI